MSTATCPECGKPLRSGARYCGSCGSIVSGAALARPEAIPPELTCTNCGNLLRSGARFCNRCGQPFIPDGAVTVPQALAGAIPPGAPSQAEQAAPDPPAASVEKSRGAGAARRPARGRLISLILLVVIMGCGLAVVPGYLAARQYGWLGRETPLAALPSQIAAGPTGAVITPTLPSSTPALTATQTRLQPTQTARRPTAEPTDTATRLAPATETTTPDESALAPAAAGVLLFEDTFDSGLSQHWLTWGEPRATIGAGFGDNWLDLKAIDPGQAGVTTRPAFSIPGAPGLVIEFDAQMDGRYPQAVLILDWDLDTFDRGPDNRVPGLIRFEIRPTQLKLSGRAARDACLQKIEAATRHTYLLRVEAGPSLALYLDGANQPVCQINTLGVEPQPGKLSFSGLGWVSRVKVLLPEQNPG
jgi:hypothetical protein